jgi:hypothetical protein
MKVIFTNPTKLISAITFFKDLTMKGQVPRRNIIEAQKSLDQIPPQLTSSQHDAYYHIFEFVSTAIEFYKFWYSNERGESVSSRERQERKEKRAASASPNIQSNYSSVTKSYGKNNYSSVASNQNTTQATLEKNYSSVASDKKHSPINQYDDNIYRSNESLKQIGEKRRSLEEKMKSYQKLNRSMNLTDVKTPTRNLNRSFEKYGSDQQKSFTSLTAKKPETSSAKKAQFTPTGIKHNKSGASTKSPILTQVEYQQNIDELRREGNEYKSRVGKMMAEHDKHVLIRFKDSKILGQKCYNIY